MEILEQTLVDEHSKRDKSVRFQTIEDFRNIKLEYAIYLEDKEFSSQHDSIFSFQKGIVADYNITSPFDKNMQRLDSESWRTKDRLGEQEAQQTNQNETGNSSLIKSVDLRQNSFDNE